MNIKNCRGNEEAVFSIIRRIAAGSRNVWGIDMRQNCNMVVHWQNHCQPSNWESSLGVRANVNHGQMSSYWDGWLVLLEILWRVFYQCINPYIVFLMMTMSMQNNQMIINHITKRFKNVIYISYVLHSALTFLLMLITSSTKMIHTMITTKTKIP